MPADNLLEEPRLGCPDVHQGLARDRLRVEPDEVDRVAGAEGEADLGIELEPTDPRALSSPRVHDDDGPLRGIDRQSLRRPDLHQHIVAGSVQLATVDEDVIAEDQDRRLALGDVLQKDVAALAHHVPEQHGAWTESTRYSDQAFMSSSWGTENFDLFAETLGSLVVVMLLTLAGQCPFPCRPSEYKKERPHHAPECMIRPL